MQCPRPRSPDHLRRLLSWGACAGLALALASCPAGAAETGSIEWRTAANSVDAQIDGWPLQKTLEQIALRTRWEIYVEPGVQHTVTAKFKDLKPGEALRRLLGRLNFVLLPPEKGNARLLVFQDSQAGATQRIVAPPDAASRVLPNELLVSLKPDAKESIEDLARRLGARVAGRMDSLRAYRLQFDDAAAADAARAALADNPGLSSIESNVSIALPALPPRQVPATAPPFTLRPRPVTDGGPIVIGLVDTAVQAEGTLLKDFLLPGISVAGQADLPAGELTHGSAMAQTVLNALATSPDAASGTPVRILPIDVYGAASSTTTYQLAQGVYEAINAGAPIINLSLGGPNDSPLLHSLIQTGHEQGILFLAAPGNEPVTIPTYPAAYPEVIAVTAVGGDGTIAPYANRGDFIDAAAPGTSLVPYDGRTFVVVGTSAATAHASAFAASMMATTGSQGPALEALLRQSLGLPRPPGGP